MRAGLPILCSSGTWFSSAPTGVTCGQRCTISSPGYETPVTAIQPSLLRFAHLCLMQYRSLLQIVTLTMRGTYSSEICKGKKGKLWEPAPKCHRVTRRAGHQKVTMECLYKFAVTVLTVCYPETPVSLHSPQGETDMRSPRGYDVAGALGGVNSPCGWYRVRGQPPSTGGQVHTHTSLQSLLFLKNIKTFLCK
jgi:hypothetical protein